MYEIHVTALLCVPLTECYYESLHVGNLHEERLNMSKSIRTERFCASYTCCGIVSRLLFMGSFVAIMSDVSRSCVTLNVAAFVFYEYDTRPRKIPVAFVYGFRRRKKVEKRILIYARKALQFSRM